MSTSFEALAVSRRPYLEASHKAQIARIGAVPLYVQHSSGTFADAVNQALSLAGNPVVLKVDDHDSYPDDHADILKDWEPGVLLYGVAEWRGCDGSFLGRKSSLCASAIPSEIRVYGSQITQSVLAQCRVREVETGVVKMVCPGDWSWGSLPGRFRSVRCSHRRVEMSLREAQ